LHHGSTWSYVIMCADAVNYVDNCNHERQGIAKYQKILTFRIPSYLARSVRHVGKPVRRLGRRTGGGSKTREPRRKESDVQAKACRDASRVGCGVSDFAIAKNGHADWLAVETRTRQRASVPHGVIADLARFYGDPPPASTGVHVGQARRARYVRPSGRGNQPGALSVRGFDKGGSGQWN
jgi:hypothetical protein